MNEQEIKSITPIHRERTAFLYTSALERGDFKTVESILEQAQKDAVLERMLLELNDALVQETQAALATNSAFDEDVERVRQIVRECLPSGEVDREQAELELPPLTMRRVFIQMTDDLSVQPQLRQEIADLQHKLVQDAVLPSNLSQNRVQQFFRELGLSASERLQKLFRQAAIFLAMGREQDIAQLTAARRQQRRKKREDLVQKDGET